LLSVALTDVSKAVELKDVNNYKLYAHSRVNDFKQFICLERAWTIESNWNPKSVGNREGKYKVYGISRQLYSSFLFAPNLFCFLL
jgi:hypothetical protein